MEHDELGSDADSIDERAGEQRGGRVTSADVTELGDAQGGSPTGATSGDAADADDDIAYADDIDDIDDADVETVEGAEDDT